MILKDPSGHEILEIVQGDEAGLTADTSLRPLTHALVLARHQGKTLLVYNRFKSEWELPGGMIDPGESPGECALRELMEESNQTLVEMGFRGLMRLKLMPDSRLEFGALYAGQVLTLRPFDTNDETTGIVWWDGKENVGTISEIDRWLALNI